MGNATGFGPGAGKLKIFLSYAAGVGKIRVMVEEAGRRKGRGQDVVIGILEPTIREKLVDAIDGLEIIEPVSFEYGGETGYELNIPAILERRPDLVLIDNIAHANANGSSHGHRWEDAEELLKRGIGVLATMNIGHLESLADTVRDITGVREPHVVPDRFLRGAAEVELVDLTPKALINRISRGEVVAEHKVAEALAGRYREVELTALRELAMREVAGRVDEDLVETKKEERIVRPWQTSDKILLCITPKRSSLRLIRRGWRMGQKLHGQVVGIYVTEGKLDETERKVLADDFALCERLGIQTVTLDGDPGERIVAYAQENNV
ncbi:sensor histidine kinase KdpD, partial [bacterium]